MPGAPERTTFSRVHLFGLTGGVASGKSSVAARLAQRGVPVIDADQVAREAVAKGTPALAEIAKTFGAEYLTKEGELDRKALAAVVFKDEGKRRALNAIVHPRVAELGMARAAEHAARGAELVCYEAALLVENRLTEAFRPLVVVAAPPELQLARAMARDGEPEDVVRGRLAAQMPLAEKVAQADFVVENTGTRDDLVQKTDELLEKLCARLGIDPARYPAPR